MLVVLLTGCTSLRETQPARTATEQLLISSAADRAIASLRFAIEPGTKVLVRTYHLESYDEGYVLGALRDRLLRDRIHLVDDEAEAALILEVRAGALSIDKRADLIGLPSFAIPVPFAGPVETPEIAIFKRERQEGIAKLAVTSYDPRSGSLHSSSGTIYGSSTLDRWGVLFFGWTDEDMGRDSAEAPPRDKQAPGRNK